MSLIAKGITKSYGGVAALRGADLNISDGEIHALLGPNGSGKSTLIRCLSGAIEPDSGTISVAGIEVTSFSPRTALASGISVIYQQFSLVPPLSVSDNIFLGSELTKGGRIDRPRQRQESRELVGLLGRPIDPDGVVATLRVGEKQLVEIAKALRHKPSLLILDEPTSALSDVEARALGRLLRSLRDQGLAILYVTHFMNEVFEIGDRVTVLRDGSVALSAEVGRLTKQDVISAIAPGANETVLRRERTSPLEPKPVLELMEFGDSKVGPMSLSVSEGEVVGIIGLLGSGRTELLEGVFGIRKFDKGAATVLGRSFSPRTPREAIESGVALIAADRSRQSMLGRMSALDNVLIPHFARLSGGLRRNRSRELTEFLETARKVALRPAAPSIPANSFSGGNQQKIAVGRWLTPSSTIRLLLLDEPTQGIDVGARKDLYALLLRLAEDTGLAVLFTSSDPDEVEALADRAIVLNRGRIGRELKGAEITQSALLTLVYDHALEPAA
jgi:ribose transport system ATP-binding protein